MQAPMRRAELRILRRAVAPPIGIIHFSGEEKKTVAIIREHSNPDLRVFGDVTVPDAVTQGIAMVKAAKNRNPRGIVWFGESHPYTCDVNRRQALFDHFYPDEGLILVAESGLESGARLGSSMVETLLKQRGKGGITEADDRRTYGVAERNNKISAAIAAECNKDPKTEPRPVVIFFGDDHAGPIKKLLATSLNDDVVEWWDAPLISDTLLARANTTLPSASTHRIVCGAKERNWGSDADVRLLQRACGLSIPGSCTFNALSPIYYQMERFEIDSLTYALFAAKDDPVLKTFNLWNPTGRQAVTFEYPNFTVPTMAPYTVVYVKTENIYQQVKDRAEAEG